MNFSEHFDENNYEFNKESSNGVYIIHGFTNTTYEVKELAEYLSHQNFHVIANNLPGHGTTPKDCNRHTYKDWIQATEQGVAEMTSSCKNAIDTSVNFMHHWFITANDMINRMDSDIGDGLYVSSHSSFIPCTISLALCTAAASASGAFLW